MSERPKVLVKEKIAEAGVDLLRERFDVEVGTDWPEGELESRIGEFDAILIRSATKMTPELIGAAAKPGSVGGPADRRLGDFAFAAPTPIFAVGRAYWSVR